MKKFAKYVLIILASWFLIHTVLIIADGLTDEYVKSDVGVVLGNKVNADGTLSERLKKRLDRSIELYDDSLIGHIIVSGGLGKEGHLEGTKMYEYLVQNGIPIHRIVVDNLGSTTKATAENVRKMNLKIQSVTVISQYYHLSRTKLAFKNAGFVKVYAVHAKYFEVRDLYSIFREFFAYYNLYL